MNQRLLEPEMMDDPTLDEREHFRALKGLARLNLWSGSGRIIWQAIRNFSKKTGRRSFRVLDLATGGGDIPVYLWKKSRAAGLCLEIHGCDKSSQAVAYAGENAKKNGAHAHFFPLNVLSEEIPTGYEILTCSLFFHHLKNEEASSLLKAMADAAGRMVLVNDLVRSVRGLALAYAGTRLLSGSRVVRGDGILSVRAAFTLEEMRTMARRAGLEAAHVRPRWPARFLLDWEK